MVNHKKIYITEMDYAEGENIPCEMCYKIAVDIHHITPRGMGGSKCKDYIENLIALCRECHIKAENEKQYNNMCRIQHLINIIRKLENDSTIR